ncbi:MAG: hypothetical protein K9K75_04030 [Deltaproteobacteria bacterium]|nr:hypothetical protein [Deltaproteobacteria bacterium]
MTAEMYLVQILQKYTAKSLINYSQPISKLKNTLQFWASSCYVNILDSGSRAKGTAISLVSDVDYLVSLTSGCNENSGGLKSIYDGLYTKLNNSYQNVRKQNVSVRINLGGLQVDVTPARKQNGLTNDHWVYLSKSGSRQQTNIQKHITDISQSGRTNEIKIIKIWRELNQLDFPSIYLEYLIVKNILQYKGPDFASNAFYIFQELAKDTGNPLFARVVDPANSNNILSDLLTATEKGKIMAKAKVAVSQQYWEKIVW